MVVVLNFGSQFAHLIARRVRDLGVKAEILRFNVSPEEIQKFSPSGIILSGSPASVLEKGSPWPRKEIFDLGIPILGICYGEQVMAHMLVGKVQKGTRREFGKEILKIHFAKGVFSGLEKEEVVWFSHGDQVVKLPRGFVRIASTSNCQNAAIVNKKKSLWGIQFHPEVTHTEHGMKILSNFLFGVCGAKKDWKISSLATELVEFARKQAGKNHVAIGISGGVDSLVAATVLRRAIGKQLHPIFVDTGLLRKGEVQSVSTLLKRCGFKNVRIIDAENMFLRRLRGVRDPEKKRKIIGHAFIEVFEKELSMELKKFPIKFLAQGTIYPDRIESAEPSKHASKIKSHHNLTLPAKMRFEMLEPLKELYKDEVRELGKLLGLPAEFLWRHPFPGPGLAVRIVGVVTKEKLDILRNADAVFMDELKKSGEYAKIWQAFAVLLPLKTVGVMGDARTYEYMIALRAVDSVDGMSADWHKIPPQLLEKISSRIVGEVRGVNRVLYDVTQKPPATIEYE